MGVAATATTSAFFLPSDRLADAVKTIRGLAKREPEEFHDAAAVAKAKTFADALLAGGWRSTSDAAGNVVEIRFAGGRAPKESSDAWPLPMFRALSPLFAATIVDVTFDEAPSTYVLIGAVLERWYDEPSKITERRRRDTIRRRARALVAAARKRADAPPLAKTPKPAKRRAVKSKPVKRAAARRAPSVSGPELGVSLDMAADDDLLWHRDIGLVPALVEALEPNGLWFDFDRMSVDHEDAVRLDRKRLAKLVAAWEHGTLELRGSEDGAAPHVYIHTGGILADVRMYTPQLDASRKDIIDGIVALARLAASLTGERARVRDGSIYSRESLVLPAPAREHDLIRLGTLVDFFGVRWCAERMPELLAALLDADLPAGATRERYDDLVVLRWIDDPTDLEQHAAAYRRQQDWWVSHFPEPPAD